MDEYLCFIKLVGEEIDEYYRYEFIFTNNIDDFEIIEDNEPCCLSLNIDPKKCDIVHIVKMKIKLDLIQNNCCFSFAHAKLGIISLGWENIDAYTEFPSDGRIFFKFGETLEEVERKLAVKNVVML